MREIRGGPVFLALALALVALGGGLVWLAEGRTTVERTTTIERTVPVPAPVVPPASVQPPTTWTFKPPPPRRSEPQPEPEGCEPWCPVIPSRPVLL